jgi:porin
MVYDPRNAQNQNVLEHPFEDGVTTSLSVTFPMKPNGLPGYYSIRGVYSTQDGLNLEDIPQLLLPPESQNIETKDGYLYGSVSLQQYLWQDATNLAVGWGVFGQASISDGNPNPLYWTVMGGVGGTGVAWLDRDLDSWGVGYFYYGLSDHLKTGLDAIGLGIQNEQAIEAYYNLAVAPWLRVTADLQWIDPATPGRDDAVLAALRTQIKF